MLEALSAIRFTSVLCYLIMGIISSTQARDDNVLFSGNDVPLTICNTLNGKPMPGHPDVCLYYLSRQDVVALFKLLGRPTQVNDVDEYLGDACNRSIHDNIKNLSSFYGQEPSVSIPDEPLRCSAGWLGTALESATLKPPPSPVGQLHTGGEAGGIPKVVASLGHRLDGLDRHVAYLRGVQAETEHLVIMKAAGELLSERMKSIESSIRRNEPWPATSRLAGYAWDAWACMEADGGAYRSKETALFNSDPVIGYQFYMDWKILVSWPLSHLFVIIDPPPPSCPPSNHKFESLLTPFFVQSKDTVSAREGRPLFAINDVVMFRDVIDGLSPRIEGTYSRFRKAVAATLDYLRSEIPAAEKDLAQAAVEIGLLRDASKSADAERETQEKKLRVVLTEVASVRTNLAVMEDEIGRLKDRGADARRAADVLTAKAQLASEQVTVSRSVLAAITLACGGKTYTECENKEAKLSYDKALFDANVAIQEANEDLSTSRIAALDARKRQTEVGDAEVAKLRDRASLRGREKQLEAEGKAISPHLERVTAVAAQSKELLQAAEQEVAPLKLRFQTLKKVVGA